MRRHLWRAICVWFFQVFGCLWFGSFLKTDQGRKPEVLMEKQLKAMHRSPRLRYALRQMESASLQAMAHSLAMSYSPLMMYLSLHHLLSEPFEVCGMHDWCSISHRLRRRTRSWSHDDGRSWRAYSCANSTGDFTIAHEMNHAHMPRSSKSPKDIMLRVDTGKMEPLTQKTSP